MPRHASIRRLLILAMAALAVTGTVGAQDGFVIPANGNSGPDTPAGLVSLPSDCDAGIVLDDGSFENGLIPVFADVVLAQRFSIPADGQIVRVCVALAGIEGGGQDLQYEIVVYDATGAGGTEPGAELARVPAAQADNVPDEPTYAFYSTDVAIPVEIGDVYVGVEHISPIGAVSVGVDLNSGSDLQSFFEGAWGTGFSGGFGDTYTAGLRIVTVADPDTRATFAVTKEFTDGDNPTEVEVTINCFTGLPIEQSQTITEDQGVEFVVTDFDTGELDCEITEEDLLGYTPTYNPDGPGSFDADGGCNFQDVGGGADNTCHIVNDADFVDVEIEKVWVIDGSGGDQVDTSYKLTLFCDAVIEEGQESCYGGGEQETALGTNGGFQTCRKFYGNGSEVFIAPVQPEYPSSHCWVVETVYDSAVEIDNDCGNLVISAGSGDSCVITNTVFFEGIPTLSQHGVAIMALLMLGVGLVGFRRFI